MEAMLDTIRGSFYSIIEDTALPKSLKSKMGNILEMFNSSSEISLKLTKILNELEEITSDCSLSPHLRTQIWNLISSLEGILTVI